MTGIKEARGMTDELMEQRMAELNARNTEKAPAFDSEKRAYSCLLYTSMRQYVRAPARRDVQNRVQCGPHRRSAVAFDRSDVGTGLLYRALCWKFFRQHIVALWAKSLSPVSYTHLDVYKRQVHRRYQWENLRQGAGAVRAGYRGNPRMGRS